MNKFFKAAALSALIATGVAGASGPAKADIYFRNTTSDWVRITLQCPQGNETLFVFSPGERKTLDCRNSIEAFLRVRTDMVSGGTHVTRGWVHDGETVLLFRNRRGHVDAVVDA